MIIGLTGNIATGKTTVAKILVDLGASHIDVDQYARDVLKKDSDAYLKAASHFGSDILNNDGEINRKKLGEIIFRNDDERKYLESITHPATIESVERKILELKGKSIIVVDAPLLIEANMLNMVDVVWITQCAKGIQLERIVKRDGLTAKEALNRINSQVSFEEKRQYADRIFYTDTDIDLLRWEVKLAVENLRRK